MRNFIQLAIIIEPIEPEAVSTAPVKILRMKTMRMMSRLKPQSVQSLCVKCITPLMDFVTLQRTNSVFTERRGETKLNTVFEAIVINQSMI